MTVAELIERLKQMPQDYTVREGYQGIELEPENVMKFDDLREVYV